MAADNRPPLQGALTVSVFLSGLAGILYTFTGAHAEYGMFYPAANTLLWVGTFVALSLAWERERWGVYLFGALVLLKLGLGLWSGAFRWWDLLLLLPLGYFVFFRSRFD
jgi:hypothetical protein